MWEQDQVQGQACQCPGEVLFLCLWVEVVSGHLSLLALLAEVLYWHRR